MSGGPPYGGGGGFGYPRSSISGDRRKLPKAQLPEIAASSGAQWEDQDSAAAASLARAVSQEEANRIAEWNNLNRWGLMTNTIADYRRIEQIGEGTYGQVYRAHCLSSGREVALKKIRVTHPGYYGLPPTIVREIKILKALRHRNMVELVEVVSSKGVEDLDEDDEREDDARRKAAKQRRADRENKAAAAAADGAVSGDGSGGSPSAGATGQKVKNGGGGSGDILKSTKSSASASKSAKTKKDRIVDAREGYKGNLFIVLEYVSHDLTGLIDMQVKFTEVQIKTIFRQLLDVLDYMHGAKYVHRDIKSSNILIDSHFRVKLADFGLARCIAPPVWDQSSDE
jgi:serine/threonine protein kinase